MSAYHSFIFVIVNSEAITVVSTLILWVILNGFSFPFFILLQSGWGAIAGGEGVIASAIVGEGAITDSEGKNYMMLEWID